MLERASRMALRSLAEGRSQKMRRWNLRSTASSRSCGRLVAPSTTTLSAVGPLPLRAFPARFRACSLGQQVGCWRSHCSQAALIMNDLALGGQDHSRTAERHSPQDSGQQSHLMPSHCAMNSFFTSRR